MVATLAAADGRVLQTICWKAPEQNPSVLSILRGFRAAGIAVEAVMEPSGTYGGVLRHQLEQDTFPVYMVSGKRTHDAKEIFDGVPSLHDAKAAAVPRVRRSRSCASSARPSTTSVAAAPSTAASSSTPAACDTQRSPAMILRLQILRRVTFCCTSISAPARASSVSRHPEDLRPDQISVAS